MNNKLLLKADIFAVIWIVLVMILLLYAYPEYMSNHKYYYNMLSNISNINLTISSFMISLVIAFILFWKRNLQAFLISLFLWLIIWWWIWISTKSPWLLGSGFLVWIFNVIVIFGIILLFLSSIVTIGRWLKIKLFGIKENNLFGVITWFGLGLSLFILINYFLILFNLYYPIVNWVVFLFMIFFSFIYLLDLFKNTINIINDFLKDIFSKISSNYMFLGIWWFLLIISIMYFLYWFVMSYIPYPTAWDANHAYMFYPKMWALNNWFYWDELNINTTPYLWLSYIAFWFSLFLPFVNKFWIAPDTLAVVMNFLSGIFVLFFSLAILSTFIFGKNRNSDNSKYILFFSWWLVIILWLTSGMGAFLVFVDNKTDLGVLTMILLALYSWFLLFKYILERNFMVTISKWENSIFWKLAILSGFFFAIAVSSKPTAFFDVVNFTLFLIFTIFSHGLAIWIFFFVLAYLVFSKFRGIVDYIPNDKFKVLSIVWLLFSILWLGEIFYRFKDNFSRFFWLLGIFFVWWVSFLLFLIVIKWTWVWMEVIYYDRFSSLIEIIKAILFT